MGTMDLRLHIVMEQLLQRINSARYSEIAAYLVVFLWVLSFLGEKGAPRVSGAKVAGGKGWWEVPLLLKVRYFFDASSIISDGYKKFKNIPFVVRRYDTDVNILPIKYLDEIRAISKNKLSAKIPVVSLLVPKWTGMTFMLSNYLLTHALNDRLTPRLDKYLIDAQHESEWAWSKLMPQNKEWAEVDIQDAIRKLVSRMSARVFVGYPACRNTEWINVSLRFTEDIFVTAFILRMFPFWSHCIVAYCLPTRWRLYHHYKTAQRIIGDLMQKHKEAKERGEEPEDTLLSWMIEHGTDSETEISQMAARQCALTLASIHTTSLGVTTVLFQLCSHPEWIPVLREEVEQVTKEFGSVGENDQCTAKQWTAKLEKMDSFIMETLRFSPAILVGPQRYAIEDLVLKDGTKIPSGATLAWAAHNHSNDSDVTPDPAKFDPMRSYRKRKENDGVAQRRFTAEQPTASHLAFGFGGQACPGRHFAVNEMKLMLSRLLVEYDFSWPEGKSHPKSIHVNEMVIPNPSAKVMMKLRKVE